MNKEQGAVKQLRFVFFPASTCLQGRRNDQTGHQNLPVKAAFFTPYFLLATRAAILFQQVSCALLYPFVSATKTISLQEKNTSKIIIPCSSVRYSH
jgi:hypothetical protein